MGKSMNDQMNECQLELREALEDKEKLQAAANALEEQGKYVASHLNALLSAAFSVIHAAPYKGAKNSAQALREALGHLKKITHSVVFELSDTAPSHTDDKAVTLFAEAMRTKMRYSRVIKGRGGWDDPNKCTVDELAELMRGHLYKSNSENYIDLACLCMMLHERDPSGEALVKLLTPRLEVVSDSGTLLSSKVSPHIFKDKKTGELVVFDETQAYEVGRTHYPEVAKAMLVAYSEHYLGK